MSWTEGPPAWAEERERGAASVSRASSVQRGRRPRRDSEATESSYYGEMAHDRVFDGPVSESVPSSLSTFQHTGRARSRSNSTTTSFRFFNHDDVERDQAVYGDESSVRSESVRGLRLVPTRSQPLQYDEYTRPEPARPLLGDADEPRPPSFEAPPALLQQSVYLEEEDLMIAMAGYVTSPLRIALFVLLSVVTGGVGYLLLRWFPKLRIALLGYRAPLGECDWVVVETQWGELSTHTIAKEAYGRPISTVFSAGVAHKPSADGYDWDPALPTLHYFDYRYTRLIFHPAEGRFELNNAWKDPNWTALAHIRDGIDTATVEERQLVFSSNSIDIDDKTVAQLLVEEVLHPFYIFQVFSMVLWSLDEYYYYAACIFFISVVSVANTVVETRANMRRLREISRFVCQVRALRDGFWVSIPSSELVPGDVYEVSDPGLSYFPCDSVQLTGDAIVNESMLTGESIPVSKYPATAETLQLLAGMRTVVVPDLAKSFLFCGTKIVRVRRPESGEHGVALAMVVRTGFNTTKGALVRSMLFPKPSGFKFYRDSLKYIAFMALMAACGFVFYTIDFIRLGLSKSLIAFRALDLITIVVPPALPATLTIGTNIALTRLKKKNIFCISPNRVNVGGKLDIVCFDKTGTLTEDGLDVFGVHAVENGAFTDLVTDAAALLPASPRHADKQAPGRSRLALLFTMATCHSLRLIDSELVGDPLDHKMFKFTGWSYEEEGARLDAGSRASPTDDRLATESQKLAPAVAHPPAALAPLIAADSEAGYEKDNADLGIIRLFEFVSQLRRMSVVIKRFKDTGMQAYVKGAPEIMRDICRPETFPDNYEQILDYYTHKGYRVIACAAKPLPKLTWFRAQKLRREDVETDLAFVGLIVFENKLKDTTASIIAELKAARLRTVMCTGDNVLTAISVGRECGLVDRAVPVFVPHLTAGVDHVEWQCVDDPELRLDSRMLLPLPAPSAYSADQMRRYSLAVTGEVFRFVINCGSPELIERMLIKADIYARMSPDEKHELVENLQAIDYSVGFCGDGANDCGALKAADVGISLSEAEASVAAPFTSRIFDISCVPNVIREGRASLVTSFNCFKYMSLYSAIQFTTVGILYKNGTNLGDFQFLTIDMFLILPIAVFMAWAGPYPVLCPKRPTANLVSQKILIRLVGQILISVVFQFMIWLLVQRQPWYIPPVPGSDDSHVNSSDNTALFLSSSFQYIFIAIVLSVGPPYREPFYKNVPFMVTIAATTALMLAILFRPPQWVFNLLLLTEMTTRFKVTIVLFVCMNFLCSWLGEKYVFLSLSTFITHTRRSFHGGRRKQRKKFKLLKLQQEYLLDHA
ncbi:uncharacterized protein V1510DRAFT_429326 [Dipodascopsis tothii]|uniref:uncharacterized protein n=1 Tax=Dipodascopsis tothii TaxID=44089 RepID=UPI0034CEF0B6